MIVVSPAEVVVLKSTDTKALPAGITIEEGRLPTLVCETDKNTLVFASERDGSPALSSRETITDGYDAPSAGSFEGSTLTEREREVEGPSTPLVIRLNDGVTKRSVLISAKRKRLLVKTSCW